VKPRFSILLPTRNGGRFIENCIHSALSQDHDSFELVVSDNANTDETPSILANIDDPRLKVVRQDVVLPVQENWNASLTHARGEYFIMLGDDDYLLPGALRKLDAVLRAHADPDCVLFNAYSYIAPNSIDTAEASYWSPYHHRYDASFKPGILDRSFCTGIVKDMFRFRPRIPLNMQTTVFSRRSIEHMPPPVFRAPFPDHYLLNALLLKADRWLYLPERLIVVGVSPKSFGHFFYGQQSQTGLEYLGIETRAEGLLPGNELLNGMYRWLRLLLANYPKELAGVRIHRSAYLVRQLRFWAVQARLGAISAGEFLQRLTLLSVGDWLRMANAIFDAELWRRVARMLKPKSKAAANVLWPGLQRIDGVHNIREFSDWVSAGNR
jgi:hypothetical protein